MLTYITLDVVGQTCSLCVDGNSRSGVCSLNVGIVIEAVMQLEKEKSNI